MSRPTPVVRSSSRRARIQRGIDLHAPDELGDLEEQVLTQAEEMPIEELVKLPESQTLEFKSSMRYDLRQGGATRPLSKLS